MPTALVTGANGFIGAHLVKALSDRAYTVRCLVRATSDLTALQGIPGVTLYLGDLRQVDTLAVPVSGVDYIFHLGARLLVVEQAEFDETNTQGTINMLETAVQCAGASLKRFLYVSSQAAVGPNPDPTPYDESVTPRPVSWYGSSKAKAEAAVMTFKDRLPVTIVRPSVVYGERERDLSQTFPVINAHVHTTIGFRASAGVLVYVGDLVEGMIAAAESANTLNQIYFLSNPQVFSLQQSTNTIAQAMNKPWGIPLTTPVFMIRLMAPLAELSYRFTHSRPPITRDKALELTQPFWVANPDKARRDFGWQAQHSLLDGMRKTTQYYFAQQRALQEMALEDKRWLWFKYILVGMLLGLLIEITSALGAFYVFDPRWLVIVVVLGAFGLVLGSAAMLLRTRGTLTQFIVGTLLALGAELPVAMNLFSFRWFFTPGFPFGINNIYLRSIVLGCAGGVFILVLNAIMKALYERRLKQG